MIVNYTEEGWQVIAQRSHGLLAAQLCAQWRKKDRPARWTETLIATAEHDDVFNEFENDKLLDNNGAPLNFKETTFETNKAQRLIDMAETKSSYIALLISRHLQFVHGDDPTSKDFLKKLLHKEKSWLQTAGTTVKEIDRSYGLLEFCDAFSLLLCQGLVQPEGRRIQIGNGPDRRSYDMHMDNGKLKVTPWPFEDTSFVVSYESRTINQLSFAHDKDFRSAIRAAKVKLHTLMLSK